MQEMPPSVAVLTRPSPYNDRPEIEVSYASTVSLLMMEPSGTFSSLCLFGKSEHPITNKEPTESVSDPSSSIKSRLHISNFLNQDPVSALFLELLTLLTCGTEKA